MNKTENDTLRTVVRSMKRQSIYEKYLVLQPLASRLKFRLNLEEMEFGDDELYCFPISLKRIYSAQIHENKLYILCDNFVMHIVDVDNGHHWSKVLEEQPGFGRLALWIFKLKLFQITNKFSTIYHKCMKNKKTSNEELLSYLKTLPEPTEEIDEETGNMIIGILSGIQSDNLLDAKGKESIFEITLQNGKFICLLDESCNLRRLFRENKEYKKITRLK